MAELDEMRRAILAALTTMEEPAGCGEIARKADLPTPRVVGRMRDGLVDANSVTVSPDGGHLYVAGNDNNAVAVFSRDGITGALTFVERERDGIGGVDGLDGAWSVAVSPDGGHVYVTGSRDDAVAVFGRDGVTGALTFVEARQSVPGLEGAVGVADH